MTETFDGVRFEYEFNGCKGTTPSVVFLHGWGGDLSSFAGAYRAVTGLGVPAYNIAFPKSVPKEWGVFDYASLIAGFFKRNGIENPTVVGHSFGGRVAIILASEKYCGKLMLVDAAGMKPRFSPRKKLAVARYHRRVKRGKPLDGMGSADYNNTSGNERKVFVRIVNTHLDRLLKYVVCPTVIVWGRRDRETPPYMARRLHRGIKGSRLIYIDGGHYGYVESNMRFACILKDFISE